MARIVPATMSVRPMPTVVQMAPCPSNIISSPNITRYNNRIGHGGGLSASGMNANRKPCNSCNCCCSCIHIDFLKRTPGFLKISEAVLGVICQFLLLEFGAVRAIMLGESYTEFLISVSTCLITTVLLLACYIISKNTYHLLRSSIFETAFNTMACVLYLSSSSYLAFTVNTRLWVDYVRLPFFQVFPALTATYVLGFVAGVVHGIDAYLAYRYLQFGR